MLKATLAIVAFATLACEQEKKDFGKRPDWSLTTSDGKKVSASDFDGKVVIVDFWATWCPPCREEIPGFIKLQKQYGEKGLVIVGFSFDKNAEIHDKWIKEKGLNYTSIFMGTKEGKAVVKDFEKVIGQIEGYPTTIIIDKKGQIIFKMLGGTEPEEFEKVFKPLL